MKLRAEQKNKIFAFIFIFIISIYIAAMVHEIGHAISSIFLGCNSPTPMISLFITGQTFCNYPEGWLLALFSGSNIFSKIIFSFAGPAFVSLIGIILFLIFRKSNYIRKHWTLAFIFYCLIFNFLLNGSLQFISGGDSSVLINLGINQIYFYIIGGILLSILLYHAVKFKELMKLAEPKMKEKISNKLRNWFLMLFFAICIIYLILQFL